MDPQASSASSNVDPTSVGNVIASLAGQISSASLPAYSANDPVTIIGTNTVAADPSGSGIVVNGGNTISAGQATTLDGDNPATISVNSEGSVVVASNGIATTVAAQPSGTGIGNEVASLANDVTASAGSPQPQASIAAFTAGGQAYTANSENGAFVIGSSTITAGGPAATLMDGHIVSAGLSGIVVDGSTTLAVSAADGASSDPTVESLAPGSGYAIGSETITAGRSAAVVQGTTYSALPSGSGVLAAAGGASSTMSRFGSQAAAASGFVIDGQTVLPGGSPISEQGTTYSALASGSGIVVAANGVSSTIAALGSDPITLGDGVLATPLTTPQSFKSGFVVDGQTAVAGASAIVEQGTTYSALLSGSGLVIAANGISSTATGSGLLTLGGDVTATPTTVSGASDPSITQAAEAGAVFTAANGQVITAIQSGASVVLVDGSSTGFVKDGMTVTLAGQTIVVASNGDGLVLGGSQTVSLSGSSVLTGETTPGSSNAAGAQTASSSGATPSKAAASDTRPDVQLFYCAFLAFGAFLAI